MKTLEQVVKELPPDLQGEVRDFAEFLLDRTARPRQQHLRMSWAGGLREFRDEFTAMDLQRKAIEWWSE